MIFQHVFQMYLGYTLFFDIFSEFKQDVDMLDRATVVDDQFINRVKAGVFPQSKSDTGVTQAGLDKKTAIEIFDSQLKSRLLDLLARQLKDKGLSFYTIGSSGHEGNAVFAQVFPHSDMAFLHYRSGAFYIQRAKQVAGHDGVMDILYSLVASAFDPISGGRHKVFGSRALNIPPQTSTIASHLPKALGAAISITRARELGIESQLSSDAVILCSFGDASLNHASAQTTLNACSWLSQHYPLPIVFICEDNGIGISVATPQTWVEHSVKNRPGIHYIACDGLNIADSMSAAKKAMHLARSKRKPVFVHMRCVRLLGHAGSDIESQYRSLSQIEATEADDPLLHTAALMVKEGWMSQQAIIDLYQDNRALIEAKAMDAIAAPKLNSAKDIMASIVPKPRPEKGFLLPSEAERKTVFGEAWKQLSQKRNLCQMINMGWTDLMLQYPHLLMFGEDVGKKGGVYRVSADLQARFGQRRVFDTLLDETTILGTAIGLAHNGFIPVPEIQFLAYLHNAQDQLRGEAATLSFFSSGQYCNPMIIRIASLAYQKGFGGHFHNDNSIAVLRDLPGVIVACPSNGSDAVKMMRTCVAKACYEGRVIVFLEPIALYMSKDLHEEGDKGWLCEYPKLEQQIDLGEVAVHGSGSVVLLSYANGYYLSRQAQKLLKENYNLDVKCIDLRWLSPLPEEAIIRETARATHILIVDEGRKSASISEALVTLLLERGKTGARIKRLTGEDSFITLGSSWQHLLPSRDSIINAVLALVDYSVSASKE